MTYPGNFAPPLEVIIEASNGASDYGNKFGEPVISGFARSFGLKLANGERREYIKPIMFSGGVGALDSDMTSKLPAEKGRFCVNILMNRIKNGDIHRIKVMYYLRLSLTYLPFMCCKNY